MIEATGLNKSFGDVQALQDVSFVAPDGEITGILGPNGAGKTTTLRIISTILRPDGGTATVDGHDVLSEPLSIARRIGVLPHSHGLYSRMTARENVRYFGLLHGLDGPGLESRIDAIVKLLDMQDIVDRRTEGFSEGQRAKVAIARALVHDPHNVILDEPTAGLDVMSSRRMRDSIRRLRDEGKCVLFSTHQMHEVGELCERVVIIADGVVKTQASPRDLLESTGHDSLEEAFIAAIGTEEGLMQ